MKLAGRFDTLTRPWVWSYLGALLVWLAAIAFTHGYGAGGMITAALALAVFLRDHRRRTDVRDYPRAG